MVAECERKNRLSPGPSAAAVPRRRFLQVASGSATAVLAAPLLAAGGRAAPEVLIGQSSVLSGPYSVGAIGFQAGAQTAFDIVNSAGGVFGKHIRLVSLDDGLSPPKAAEIYQKLLDEHRVLSCFGGAGTPTTAAAIPILRQAGVPLIGNIGVSDSVRQIASGIAFFPRASFGREVEKVIEHLTTVGITRVAVAYLANSGGEEFAAVAQSVMRGGSAKSDLVASVSVRGDASDAGEASARLSKVNPQAVIMYLVGSQASALVRSLLAAGCQPSFYGLSLLACDVLSKEIGTSARNGITACQIVPYPWSNLDPTAIEYRRRATEHRLPVNYYTYEGYLNAQLLIDVMRRAGPEPSRERLLRVLNDYRGRLAGMDLDFSTGSSTGSRFVDLVQARPDGTFIR